MNASSAVAPPRLREWWAVVREEKELTGSWPNPFKMVAKLFHGRVSKNKWRERLVTCSHCPIFDGELRRCRLVYQPQPYNANAKSILAALESTKTPPPPPPPKQVLGCGCYVPYVARLKAPYTSADGKRTGCWGRATSGPYFGWE